ncbi:MAG: PAS domain S-box protein [Geobacteraceae bacterium]|nr:PAS domain S-box protein [Geobacteraceae bacterium]
MKHLIAETNGFTDNPLLQTRITLLEYATTHSLDNILTKTLDETGALVNSPIGFYHFVDTDQQTLCLQQWSTRTLNEFCRAEGRRFHYSIDQAGVWADCVREKMPVVHNNFAGLPQRKGFPEGHAEVVRELVVPIMREGRVVSILGVGNKPSDYTEKDVETVAYLADVTWEIITKKRAEENLADERQRLANIIEGTNIGTWEWNIQTGETVFNNKWAQAAGYSLDELSPTSIETWTSLAHADDLQQLKKLFKVHVSGELPYFDHECRIKHKSGHWVRVQIRGRIVTRTKDGKPLKMSGTQTDITKYKRVEEALREREELYRELVENANSIIYRRDQEGNITFFNEFAQRFFGYHEEEIVGCNVVGSIVPETDSAGRNLRAMIRDIGLHPGRYEANENENMLRDGARVWVSWTNKPLLDSEGNVREILCVGNDATERKRAEEEREELQDQLNQARKMESVGRLAGGVAHDFNNMLGVILGHTEMALAKSDPAHPLFHHLQAIHKAAGRSADLTRQLLAFARKQAIAPKLLDLNETVEGMLNILRRLIGEDVDLAWKPGGELWPVKVDPSQLDQILTNLCVNARDAIAGVGKVIIETANAVFDKDYCSHNLGFVPGEYVLLAVSDDGCGMDRETLGNIFDPFFTTKGVGEGTGLGLAMVYGSVRQNNGFINVYSEPGQGTTFKIYLPRQAVKSFASSTAAPEPIRRGLESILLVEDEPAILEIGRSMLESFGYSVRTADSPGEAIKMAEEHVGVIDLLVTDVIMPEMTGRDLAKKLLSLYPNLSCLYMSGYTADVIAHRGVLGEGVHFIQKPFSMQGLAAKVREALEGDAGYLYIPPK